MVGIKEQTTWRDYLEGNTQPLRGDLNLIPGLLRGAAKPALLQRRFRWLLEAIGDDAELSFEIWRHPENAFLDERLQYEGHLSNFHVTSGTFPYLLAKSEVDELSYYHSLHRALRALPTRAGAPVAVIGPTFGAEVEVAKDVGAMPSLIGKKDSRWLIVAEERLLHDGVEFASVFRKYKPGSCPKFMVLSRWIADPARAVRATYDAMGEFGFLFFPSRTISMTTEAERLGMLRRFSGLPDIAVFYKHIGLPILGESQQCS